MAAKAPDRMVNIVTGVEKRAIAAINTREGVKGYYCQIAEARPT